MLFARYTTAQACQCTIPQACQCTRVVNYARLLQMQWGARACKSTEERTVMFCANTNTTRGNSLPELCTGSWSCPAPGLALGIGKQQLKQSKWAKLLVYTNIHTAIPWPSSELFRYKPLCANAQWPATVCSSEKLYDQPPCAALNSSTTSYSDSGCVTLLIISQNEPICDTGAPYLSIPTYKHGQIAVYQQLCFVWVEYV